MPQKIEVHQNVEWYYKLIGTIPEVECKGAKMPYTSLNGNMFSFMSNDGRIGIRLPEKEREAFLKKYKTELFNTHGTVLKEYVTVPDNLLTNTKALSTYFELSYKLVKSLKPKSTGKNKK